MADWYRDGAAAEYMAVEARNLAAKPTSLGHVEAAALSLAGLTAWQALFVHGELESDQTVVITGASGGVAPSPCSWRSTRAPGWWRWRTAGHTLSSKSLGPKYLSTRRTQRSRAFEGADLLFDLVGGDLASQCSAMLRDGATVMSVVDAELRAPSGGRSQFFVVEADRAQLERLAGLVEAGRLRAVVGHVRHC